MRIGKGHAHRRVAEQVVGRSRRGNRGRGSNREGLRRGHRSRHGDRRRHVAARGKARHEPPSRLAVRQRAHRGDDLQPRHHLEAFLARAAFAGVARQAVEHGGRRFARQRQLGRRRGFVFLHARHAAINGIAVDNRAAFAGDGPGDIGLARRFGDAARPFRAAAGAWPHRDQEQYSQGGDAGEKRVARPTCQCGLRHRQACRRQRHDKGADGSPAPAAERQADRGFREGAASVHETHSTGFG